MPLTFHFWLKTNRKTISIIPGIFLRSWILQPSSRQQHLCLCRTDASQGFHRMGILGLHSTTFSLPNQGEKKSLSMAEQWRDATMPKSLWYPKMVHFSELLGYIIEMMTIKGVKNNFVVTFCNKWLHNSLCLIVTCSHNLTPLCGLQMHTYTACPSKKAKRFEQRFWSKIEIRSILARCNNAMWLVTFAKSIISYISNEGARADCKVFFFWDKL